jgi:hypothetical protein
LEGQRLKLIYDVLSLSGMIGVFAFSHWQHISLMHAVMMLSAAGTLAFGVYYLVLWRIVSRHRSATVTDRAQNPLSHASIS